MDLALIAALLLLPTLLPLSICYAFIKHKQPNTNWQNLIKLKPESGLLQQPIFWLSILIPGAYFIAFGSVIWSEYSPDVSAAGLSTFLQISVFPLTLLSLAVPFSVVVASFHSTEQTAVQIKITNHKNNLESFYSHRNELFGYFDRLGPESYLSLFEAKFYVHPRVHKVFFIGSPDRGVPEINEPVFKQLEDNLSSARMYLHMVICGHIETDRLDSIYILNLCSNIQFLITILNLRTDLQPILARSEFIPILINGRLEKIQTIGRTATDIVAAYRYARAYYRNLCDFAGRDTNEGSLEHYYYFEIYGKYKTIKSPENIEVIFERYIPDWKADIREIEEGDYFTV
ncbi:hypothetical protein F6476_04335 [Pseudomonas umsongensis]|uniref:hypothetical protein n=1 Tax=Pseudomonas umsongensis TaxID=198618 RepID=UPI00124520B3|nr:hypothetical protein [Pseudomonas umsongensis]QFG28474.1 hypothetical protein F6476_04335 [Pseudomonas umsongensis]